MPIALLSKSAGLIRYLAKACKLKKAYLQALLPSWGLPLLGF
jgi:hypothetical protein